MALLEKYPNNTTIDAQMRKYAIDPSRISSLPVVDPSTLSAGEWQLVEYPAWALGIIGRQKVMRYDFGAPRAISPAVGNQTSSPIKRTLTGSEKIGTSTTMSISSTVQSSFFNTVNVSVTAGFSQTWSSEKTFTDEIEVTIPPGHMMWLEVKPVMRILEGDFVYFSWMQMSPALNFAKRFSGTVTAPGLEGTLRDVIVAREAPMPAQMTEALLSAGNADRSDAETFTLPGSMAAALLGDSAGSEDVTDRVLPG
ncbi:hypothetical protein ACFWBI_36730 [Streptomyces sp. NPDC059982]|uniref:hypothetical protein n=1 Tax=unclassified Streptomyces TaxID=2593676 RepID=UPI0036BFE40C